MPADSVQEADGARQQQSRTVAKLIWKQAFMNPEPFSECAASISGY